MELLNTCYYEIKDKIATITLNRPEVHNAFNNTLISELFTIFENLQNNEHIRIIILQAKGPSFCAGADLNWMKEIINNTFEENLKEAKKLAQLLHLINTHNKPIICRVQGSAFGGGVGLISACDIVIAVDEAKFALTEVRLGLTPAVISPFVINRIGISNAKYYYLTADRFDAYKAKEIGLVNDVVTSDKLDEKIETLTNILLQNSPNALTKAKELIFKCSQLKYPEIEEYTTQLIAELRISKEGQEGMNAFLQKRKPYWTQ